MSFARTHQNIDSAKLRETMMAERIPSKGRNQADYYNPNLTFLGNITRPRRAQIGMSMASMAREMLLSPATLSEYETKNEKFPISWLPNIVEILSLSPEVSAELQAKRQLCDLAKKDKSLLSDDFLTLYLKSRHLVSEEGRQLLKKTLLSLSAAGAEHEL